MNCSLTPFGGQVPNTGQTAEQNVQDCTNFMQWIVGTFVPEQNALLPRICDASYVAISAGYQGVAETSNIGDCAAGIAPTRLYSEGDVVVHNGKYYRSLKDANPAYDDNGAIATGSGSCVGGYTYHWLELPTFLPESGNNANGYYVKFPDGTLICSGSKNMAGVHAGAYGTAYFPVKFISNPVVTATIIRGANDSLLLYARIGTMNRFSFTATTNAGTTTTGHTMFWHAIGRWK